MRSVAAFRHLTWRHPEWWSLALSVAAWLVLLSSPEHYLSHRTIGASLLLWLLMVVAMMFPLVIAQVRDTAFRSLWPRRHRAIACFLAGYLFPWVVFGMAILAIRSTWTVVPSTSAVVGILIAVVWQLSPLKRHALRRCHQVIPLAPRGWRANVSCVRFGWRIGGGCIGACGGLMTACALMDHSMLTMSVATVLAISDRFYATAAGTASRLA